jgi:hypothetical protein
MNEPTEQPNDIDAGLAAIKRLRDVLNPHGIHITGVENLQPVPANDPGDRDPTVWLTSLKAPTPGVEMKVGIYVPLADEGAPVSS